MESKGHQVNFGKLKLFINGQWVESESEKIYQNFSPTTGENIGEFPSATESEVELAIQSAQKAFQKWRQVPLRDRARMIFDLRAAFEDHADWLAEILVQDHGRTMGEAIGTIRRCIENIETAGSALLLKTKGEKVNDLAGGLDQTLLWEPRGVFLIVTPSNIPMHAWSSYVPYALATGCSVIVSPSEAVPACMDAVFQVMEKVGFPPGVANLLYGGRDINEKIIAHPDVKGVGFIGSTAVGKQIYQQAAGLGKIASINGNGKNHVVVTSDVDVEDVVESLMRGCMGMAGQRCLGSDNVVIIGDIYDALKKRLIERTSAMKLGSGFDPDSELCPMVTEAGRQKVVDFINAGEKAGAQVVLDGREVVVPGFEKGYFIGPTILDGVTIDMEIAKHESFGPVICLMRAKDLDEALDWINNKNDYGHSACIFTPDGKTARKFIREADVGNVGINVPVPQPYAFFPLGSKHESAFGVAKSRIDSLRLFLEQKTVTERW